LQRTLRDLTRRLAAGRNVRGPTPDEERLAAVSALEPGLRSSSEAELRQLAQSLRERARAGVSLDDLCVQLFALVREAAHRTIGLRPFDVQILGGLALHAGKVIQMQTGEGKTLAAVAPVALNALRGSGVHVLTFNDYLARRDAEWMGPIYRFLDLRVGFVQEGMSPEERQKAYQADVTYVTAKEAGFDFLRDALVFEPGSLAQRPFHMALVDEADSILIDEARIPLVIAGTTGEPWGQSEHVAAIVRRLVPNQHYMVDYEGQTVYLTDAGIDRAEALLGRGSLHTLENLPLLTEVNAALYAAALLQRDVDYIVRHGRVEVVDEFTGRVVKDRHWPDGLQTAIEAKEGLRRSPEGRILGQITLQHFLKQYPRLCGMTATAEPAADELWEVYGLRVQVIPSNRPCIRVDFPDLVFTHQGAKLSALSAEVVQAHATGRPILVGTLTVEESERLAARLRGAGVSCSVLNAKRDEQEARIVAQAGRLGAVTISTNMAGRGTDIRLGGTDGAEEEQVAALGGLYVIGTNRHESRRVDDQLRGRAGRQGDPGSSRFFISLEDDLLQHHGIEDLFPEGYQPPRQHDPVDSPVLRRAIDHAQRVVERRNADVRQALWSYSQVVEQQRRIVGEKRRGILTGMERLGILRERVPEAYERAVRLLGPEAAADLERRLTLAAIDECWADHLAAVAEVREGIHLVAVGGLLPLEEFQKSVVRAFERMGDAVRDRLVQRFSALEITAEGVDLDAARLRGPSSTWTYLEADVAFEDRLAVALISQRNIGFAAGAAASGPLLLLWALVSRFLKRRKQETGRPKA
jgi:preprotein translocase subunit SecA